MQLQISSRMKLPAFLALLLLLLAPLSFFQRAASAQGDADAQLRPSDYWVDEVLPNGATAGGDEPWVWVNSNPAAFANSQAHQSRLASGVHRHSFTGATIALTPNTGDKLITYVFLDPTNMPREIMLEWHDGLSFEHRAYWGANNINVGVDGTQSRRFMGQLPPATKWVRLEVPANLVGLERVPITGMSFTLDGGRATWDGTRSAPASEVPDTSTPGDFVWIEDSLPAGAVLGTTDDSWSWIPNGTQPPSSPNPYSGAKAHQTFFGNAGDTVRFRSHYFTGATPTAQLEINPGDVLFTYAYIDPVNAPQEIMLQWIDEVGWGHRAYWGNNLIDLGVTGTESRRFMGAMPPAGQWVRLEVPASYVGLENHNVNGMAFSLYRTQGRGLITWDRAGRSTQLVNTPASLYPIMPLYRFYGTDYGGYWFLTTNEIGRADQTLQVIQCFISASQTAGTEALHRFRNSQTNRYFYTLDRNSVEPQWLYEGIAGYAYRAAGTAGTVPLYRFRHNTKEYFFTTNRAEGDSDGNMTYDGIAAYVNSVQSPVPRNDAAFVSQTVPNPMLAGRTYSVSLTLRNTGIAAWTSGSSYKLSSQNPQNNTTWGATRATLPKSVLPGETVTITFSVTAPSTPGTYNFQWRILQENVGAFGASSTNVPVTVLPNNGSNRATPFDFDGDGRTDIYVWRSAQAQWFGINSSNNAFTSTAYGLSADKIVPADYDGDGKTDIAVWRPSNGFWYVLRSTDGATVAQQWGAQASGDIPLPGDYDGDGRADFCVWRAQTGVWFVLQSSDGTMRAQQFGLSDDVPVPGDYDGDGKNDLAVWRRNTGVWWVLQSSNSSARGDAFGTSTDVAVPGDYDGDGKYDRAVFRPSEGRWYILQSGNGTATGDAWGLPTDIPAPGDYDGDGKTDLAVFRPSNGTWYILQSINGFRGQPFGTNGDKPAPAAFIF